MSDSAVPQKTCPQCGTALPSDATEGLCPRCLMNEAMQAADSNPDGLASFVPTVFMAEPAIPSSRPAAPEPPLPEELAALLPKGAYHVESFLGQGGMGAVYKGTQVRLKRHVAIKIMRRDQGKDHDFERRFEHEAQAMARLNHPNIVSVIDFGEAGPDFLYIVMELVEGADLMDVIRTKRMTQEMALTLLPQICDALQFAHDHGIVHRDIKPSNIMLTRDGHIKMADFGLAKRFDAESNFRTQTGTGMGTPDYAAPEQFIEHSPIDHRADIYALGVMIYQMITGTLPRGVWKPPSQRAEVDPQWDEIVSHAMQSDPVDRYQHASEIKTDVSQITPRPKEGSAGGSADIRLAAKKPFRTASTGNAAAKATATDKGARAPVSPAPPRKSRARAFFAFTAAIAALVCGAFYAIKRPPAIPARVAPPMSASPGLPVSPSPVAAEPWQDMLRPPAKLSLYAGATLAEGALAFPAHTAGQNWAGAVLPNTPADGALRITATFSPNNPGPVLRARDSAKGHYVLEIEGPTQIRLSRAANEVFTSMQSFSFSPALQAGHDYTLEFRVVGPALTVKLNGATLGTVRNENFPSGSFQVTQCKADPSVVKSVEFLPLSAASATPAAATKEAPFVNTLGMKFVPVPIIGGPTDKQRVLFSAWDTRVQDYEVFATETKREWPKAEFEQGPTHPAVMVDWNDATAFCAWLTERERKAGKIGANERYRLPSDHEWSCAMDIGDREDANLMPGEKNQKLAGVYPWGSAWPPPKGVGNYAGEEFQPALTDRRYPDYSGFIAGFRDDFVETSPVGSFPANRFDLYDMGGNVWQWCEDWSDKTQKGRVLRGASWTNSRDDILSSNRNSRAPETHQYSRGFRCVLEAAAASAEPWQDLSKEPNLEGLKVTPKGIAIHGWVTFPKGPQHDGAVRYRAPYSEDLGKVLRPFVRKSAGGPFTGKWYQGHPTGTSDSGQVEIYDGTTFVYLPGRQTHLAAPLKTGEMCEFELRVVGSRITVKINGQLVQDFKDATLSAGNFGICTNVPQDVLVQSLEVLDLDAGARSEAAFGPWQPLYTDAEWKQTNPGKREVVDGRVHFLNLQDLKPQPAADGAIRARIQFQQGSKRVGFLARMATDGACYKAELISERSVALSHFPPGGTSPDATLGTYTLPKPLHPGDTVLLELRLQGDRLTVLVDVAVAIDTRDARIPGPGKWGIIATDGWFESVEVQTPVPVVAPAVNPFGPWQPLFTDAEWKESKPGNHEVVDGRLHFIQGFQAAKPMPAADGAIRARVQWRKESKYQAIKARKTKAGEYKLQLNKDHVSLDYFPPGNSRIELNKYLLPKPLQPGDTALIELRLQGDHLTGLLNGTVVVEAQDARLPAPGEWGILGQEGWFESVEVQTTLPTAATSVPSIPSTVTKDAPFVNTLGMKFVPVPIVGGPTAGKSVLFSVWETRVQDYEVFATETKREWPKPGFAQGPTHPAAMVSWDDATAFCAWLTERERRAGTIGGGDAYRLPSDHEWSCAVGIGDREDPATPPAKKSGKLAGVYPWGTQWPPPAGAGNYAGEERQPKPDAARGVIAGYRDGFPETAPVGSFAANGFGLFDLGGNVGEYCQDWLDPKQNQRCVRGAGWGTSEALWLLSSWRAAGFAPSRSVGFRCVLEVAVRPAAASAPSVAPVATKEAPFVNTLGMKFVPVPITGGPTNGQRVRFSVWDTRVQDYGVFAEETKRAWSKPDFEQGPTHPAVMVGWDDAQAFCAWLTERERKAGKLGANERYRLPSDHEWSCAVGIGDKEDAALLPGEKKGKFDWIFPWGREWPPPNNTANIASEEMRPMLAQGKVTVKDGASHEVFPDYYDGYAFTSPVESYAPNALGLYDMGGNVQQWCEDCFEKDPKVRTLRGSAWATREHSFMLSSNRPFGSSTGRYMWRGFRIVLAGTSSTAAAAAASEAPALPAATKDAPLVNSLGMKFVPVPGTKALFSIWDTRVMDYEKYVQALEAAGKKVDGSWHMQQKDGVPVGREPDHPVVGVSWEDAQAFCQWLTEKETAEGKLPKGQRYRLPTDEEWSTAVGLPPEQGATPEEKSGKNDVDFTWGKEWPPTKQVGNYADETFHAKFPLKKNEKDGKMENEQWMKDYTDGYATTSPVGRFPANVHGLYDMSGNVWQWCEDRYNGERTERVQRGAAWYNSNKDSLRTSLRGRNAPDDRYPGGGFRCVLVPAPAAVSPSPRLPASASSPSPSAP